jgi:hypothetical protein
MGADSLATWRTTMAKKITRSRPWTKEELRMLKTLAGQQTKTTVSARNLKRTLQATYQKAIALGVTLMRSRKKKGA